MSCGCRHGIEVEHEQAIKMTKTFLGDLKLFIVHDETTFWPALDNKHPQNVLIPVSGVASSNTTRVKSERKS